MTGTNQMAAAATPLIERLRAIPKDARLWYEHSSTHHSHHPVGLMAHEAAEALQDKGVLALRSCNVEAAITGELERQGVAYGGVDTRALAEAVLTALASSPVTGDASPAPVATPLGDTGELKAQVSDSALLWGKVQCALIHDTTADKFTLETLAECGKEITRLEAEIAALREPVVTEEMISAGYRMLDPPYASDREHERDRVKRIYLAMQRAAPKVVK